MSQHDEDRKSTQARRRLPKARQVRSKDMTEIYHCPVQSELGEGRWASYVDYSSMGNSNVFVHNYFNASTDQINHDIAVVDDNEKQEKVERVKTLVRKSYLHSHRQPSTKRPIQILFTANCTGEYFGMGPTCRCQEAMRYFLSQSNSKTKSNNQQELQHTVNAMGNKFENVEWFLFMDDDVYLRPFALISLLRTLTSNRNHTSDLLNKEHKQQAIDIASRNQPIAMVSAQFFHGPMIRPKQGSATAKDKCRSLLSVDYCFAQPALLNK
jgi:hypothetical protein